MMIEQVENPTIDWNSFGAENRENGLSGFMRVRNEAEYLEEAVDSWINQLDELVIVYNNCQDNSEEIIVKCLQKYPNKIKAFHYIPIVYPQGSEKFKALPADDVHSLVNYYNFSLSKTTKKWAIKIDGDLILVNKMLMGGGKS